MSLSAQSQARAGVALAAVAGLLVLGIALLYFNLAPESVLAIILAAGTVFLLISRPVLSVHLFIMLIFVENLVSTKEGVTAMKVAGLVVVVGWLISIMTRRRLDVRFGPLPIVIALFIGWSAVAMMTAVDTDLAFERVFTFVQLGSIVIMFASVLNTQERIRGVMRAIVLWTTLSTIYALEQYAVGAQKVAQGTVGNRNLLGAYITIAIICAYLLHQMSPGALERLGLALSLPTLFLGLALTFSRTGYITLVVALGLVTYRLAKVRGYLLLAGSLTVLALIVFLLPEAFFARVNTILPSVQHQEETFGVRVQLWRAGVRMIQDHPILGVGPGNFAVALPRYAQGRYLSRTLSPHNTYVGLAAETGLIGATFFVLILLAAFVESGRAARHVKSDDKNLGLAGVAVEICLVSMCIGGLTGNMETGKLAYALFGVASSLGRLALIREGALARTAAVRGAAVAPGAHAGGAIQGI